jgi:hypothetical protein
MRKLMLVAVAAMFSGCATPMTTSFHTLGRATYDKAEKREVWGRALAQFQLHNAIVTVVDYESGVLASGDQPGETVPCRSTSKACNQTVGWQFTISDDGTCLLSVRRGISGTVDAVYRPTSLLRDEIKDDLEQDADEILAAIVGKRGSVAAHASR